MCVLTDDCSDDGPRADSDDVVEHVLHAPPREPLQVPQYLYSDDPPDAAAVDRQNIWTPTLRWSCVSH